MKTCSFCLVEKAFSDFYKQKEGYQSRCKVCAKQTVKTWQQENKERVNAKNNKWKHKTQVWNSPKAKAYCKHRTAARRTQTPQWANLETIKLFYLNCPSGWHVDHVVPLRGKLVSGLHVEDNLQYLPAQENLKKGNRY